MNVQAVKGTKDILPAEVRSWRALEKAARHLFDLYGYEEIRTPIFEHTELFLRSIGEGTDIVQKEMYTFEDPKGRSITLRPEGTAPVVRAFLENHLATQGSLHKLFYIGPMFRYERPQAGRMRQFHQIGVEALGASGPAMDAEVMLLLIRFLEKVGIANTALRINSLGSAEDRAQFIAALQVFLQKKMDDLCGDCRVRYEKNILRVLDCKNPSCRELIKGAPSIQTFLGHEAKAHFAAVQELLKLLKVPYTVEPFLVRGLDYYTGTVFEVSCSDLGAQDAIAAGGRYDGLVRTMGGPEVPAVGFAFGMERLLSVISKNKKESEPVRRGIFIASLGAKAEQQAFVWASELRGCSVLTHMDYDHKSLKSQLRFADKARCRWVVVVGEDELVKGQVMVKDLQEGSEQSLACAEVIAWGKGTAADKHKGCSQ